MKLYGMLDSPFVRRVAICFAAKQISFEHISLSVFSSFEDFSKINPMVKAPTLLLDDGTYLMDSSLILNYLDQQETPNFGFFKLSATEYQLLGLALSLTEKAVQYVYETQLRPEDKQMDTWKQRVILQAKHACAEINAHSDLQHLSAASLNQVNITLSVAWCFLQNKIPNVFTAQDYPQFHALSQALEQRAEFKAYAFP